MLLPVILFKDDFASEANSVEAHIMFEENNYKTEAEIKIAGYGHDKLEAVRQLIEGLNTAKVAIDELISFTAEAERLQKAEEDGAETAIAPNQVTAPSGIPGS